MATFAVVNPEGGVVANTVAGDSLESVSSVVGPCVEITEATGGASIGDTWNAETQTFIRAVV